MSAVKLITLDPGHFHAALVQKEMYPGVSPHVEIYAPLTSDLTAHVARIARFNARPENPTQWELHIHAGPDFLERMLRERQGNVVVLSGRNRHKIDYIAAAIDAGLHVLADKPWIIEAADFIKLEAALAAAARSGVAAYDIMTERYEVTSMLQRVLVNDPDVFGESVNGSPEGPAVYIKSVHHIMKTVAGAPNQRPTWFFDIAEEGEALADVGTHLVDLAQWTLHPERCLDYRTDIEVHSARRWPTRIDRAQWKQVTGEDSWPHGDGFDCFCNTQVIYLLRGAHIKLDVLWNWEAPPDAGDTHHAVYRGTRARVEVRQGAEEKYRPELYVVPDAAFRADVAAALRRRGAAIAAEYPGVAVEDLGSRFLVRIPDRYRVGHEAHFAQVTRQFLEYLQDPSAIPAWEASAMLAKYRVTTEGVEVSRL